MWRKLEIVTVALVAMLCAGLLKAQSPDDAAAPPASDAVVARLSAISGTVSTSRSDTGEWDTGALNTPLLAGDKVAAGEGGRAEVQLDYADILRLGGNTQVNLTALNKNQIQVQVAAGVVDYVVLKDAQATPEIDTPNLAVHPNGEGVYRVNVISDSETQVIVRKGSARISTPQGSTPLRRGQIITVEGTDSPQYQIGDAPSEDAFDRWNQNRDRVIREAKSRDYTNPYYTGVQDLDGYGDWTIVPGYGRVWVPNDQSVGWAPYSDGRWVWEPGWGWTWVSYQPWGWAPYHYGRWFVYGANWAWWPGPVTPLYRPIWAPAYVSFFGWGGGGFGVGVGFGSIGWIPVGPSDPFRPWWGYGGGTRVRVTNITVINNYYDNRRVVAPLAMAGRGRIRYSNLDTMMTNPRVRNAIVRVPTSEFGRGAVGARSRVSVAELRGGSVLGGTLPVTPTRASLSVSHRADAANAVPRRAATHFFGARGTAQSHAAQPSFAQEQHRVENSIRGEGAGGNASGDIRHSQPTARGRAFTPREANGTAAPGAARVNPQSEARGEQSGAAAARPGWRRFGGGVAAGAAQNGARPTENTNPAAGRDFRGPVQSRGGRVAPEAAPRARQDNNSGRGASLSAPPSSISPAARPGWHRFSRQPESGAAAGAGVGADGGRGFSPEASRGRGYFPGSARNEPRAEPRGEPGEMPPEVRPQVRRPEGPIFRDYPRNRPMDEPRPQPRMRATPRPPLQVGHPIVQSRGNFGGGFRGGEPRAPVFHGGGERGRR